MKNKSLRAILQAEWEEPSAILLAWPHPSSDWAPILGDAQKCVADIAKAVLALDLPVVILTHCPGETIEAIGPSDKLFAIEYSVNDTWTRDYGPIIAREGEIDYVAYDFKFNGWGLKFAADRDNLASLTLNDKGCFKARYQNERSFVLEGGSIDVDGKGRLMTTLHCLASPNRNGSATVTEIKDKLQEWFGSDRQIWLTHGALSGDDTDSHIDTLARFAPGDKILYCQCSDPSHPDYEELSLMEQELREIADADGLSIIPLPLPDLIRDPDDGSLLPATYANFLALDRAVLIPSYGQPHNDSRAGEIIARAFDRPTVMIDCRALIRQHGSLHCTTMQMPLKAIDLSQLNR